MIYSKSKQIGGLHGRDILLDYRFKDDIKGKSIILFAHGFKGYKDWGAWNVVADAFADEGVVMVKFNFSHNGGTIENPIDFPDLEAFGNNNYTFELDDLKCVLDWIQNTELLEGASRNKIGLIGHSRGGAMAIIKASEDSRIGALVTWAAVSDVYQRAPHNRKEEWKEKGVIYILNGRTGQKMPMYYQFYCNLLENKKRLNIENAANRITVPWFIIHGNKDESVAVEEGYLLAKWQKKAKLIIVENTGHTFGVAHPYHKKTLPDSMKQVVSESFTFFKSELN